MKSWEESQNEVRAVKADIEMAKSILKMMEIRINAVGILDKDEFVSLKLEGYYEIIKEAITALMAVDGYKTLSHEVLVGYLKEFFSEFPESDIILIDNIRGLRNKIVYKGFFIDKDYILNSKLNKNASTKTRQ